MEEKYLKSDLENRVIRTEAEMEDYFKFRQEHDIRKKVYFTECHCLGVADTPLVNGAVRKDLKKDLIKKNLEENLKFNISEETLTLTDEKIQEAANDNQTLWVGPIDDHYVAYPNRYTAYKDVLDAAGISGRLMFMTEKRGQYNPLDPTTKGQWITIGWHLNEQMGNVLIRDGKVEHFKGPRYQDLYEWDGAHALMKYMNAEYPEHEYKEGTVSHEYLRLVWDLNDDTATGSLKETLESFGMTIDKLRMLLQFTTSEIGNAAMRVTPVFDADGKLIPIGNPICVRHDAGNSIDMLVKEFPKIASMTKEAEDQVEKLGNTNIDNLAGCFQHIAKDVNKFTAAEIKGKVDEIISSGKTTGTAIDVYLAMVEVIQDTMASELNVARYIELSEICAKKLSSDFKAYDKPLDEE